jgi:hypothetical protein
MGIAYTNHIKEINDCLNDLLEAEYTVSIRNDRIFDVTYFGRHNEYIRFYYSGDDWVARFSDGETRNYKYIISIYVKQLKQDQKTQFEDLGADRIERLTHLITESTYQTVSGNRIWHDAKITNREIIDIGKDNPEYAGIYELKCELILTRSSLWG